MSSPTETELIDLAIKWVQEHRLINDSVSIEITPDTNLMESGLLDSTGFVELILFVESQTRSPIDLNDVDPDEFAVVRHLSRIALRHHQLWSQR